MSRQASADGRPLETVETRSFHQSSNITKPEEVAFVGDNINNNNNSDPPTSNQNSRPGSVPEMPAELLASARSLREQRLGESTNSSTGRRRKKKKNPPQPPQAHPEPRGADEAEVRMMWNRVAPTLQNGNKMTTPNEPPTLYSHTTTNVIAGGLQDQPSVASLTQPFTEPPRNLLAQARGPLEVFVANGSHPKIGWLVPDNFQLAVKPQSEGGEIQITGTYHHRPKTSDSNYNNDDDDDGGNSTAGNAPTTSQTGVPVLAPFEPPAHMIGLQQQYQQGERHATMVMAASMNSNNSSNNARRGMMSSPEVKDSISEETTAGKSTRRSRSASQSRGTNQQLQPGGAASSSTRRSSEQQQQSSQQKNANNSDNKDQSSNNNKENNANNNNASHHSSSLAAQLQQPELLDLINQVQSKPPELSHAMMMNDLLHAEDRKKNTSVEIQKQKEYQDRIASLTNIKEDGETLLLDRHLDECTQWMTDLATAVQNERHLFAQWKYDLTDEIRQLQLDRAKKQADFEEERHESQASQRAQLYLKENDFEKLKENREKVLDWLSEKKRILRELQETSISVEEAERASTLKLLDVEDDLKRQRGRLEDVLKAKLASAVDQMSHLSEAQRKARESSTVEDFNRLVKELTEQEQKMRELNATSSKLQHRIGTLRREISLESQRGQMLQEKQETYHSSISTLVHRLEDIERKYSAQSQRELRGMSNNHQQQQATNNNGNSSSLGEQNHNNNNDNENDENNKDGNNNNNELVTIDLNNQNSDNNNKSSKLLQKQQQEFLMNQQLKELPRVIDQQYAVILQLRADLVRVRSEVAQATESLQQERMDVIAAANPSNQPILSRVAKKEQTKDFITSTSTSSSNNMNNNSSKPPMMMIIKPRPPSNQSQHTTGSGGGGGGSTSSSRPISNSMNTRNGNNNGIPPAFHHHQLSIVDTMRSSEMNFIKSIVFEALADADQNLGTVVPHHHSNYNNNNNSSSMNNNGLLPPIYPVLDVLDPIQRRDVFEFVVRRINTNMLNPMNGSASSNDESYKAGRIMM